MEALGGDARWADRFFAFHSAIVYYWVLVLIWLVSPTLAYNFSELIESHAVDTYAEFVDANEALLTGWDIGELLEEASELPHERILKFSDLRDQVIHEIVNPEKYQGGESVASLIGDVGCASQNCVH